MNTLILEKPSGGRQMLNLLMVFDAVHEGKSGDNSDPDRFKNPSRENTSLPLDTLSSSFFSCRVNIRRALPYRFAYDKKTSDTW